MVITFYSGGKKYAIKRMDKRKRNDATRGC